MLGIMHSDRDDAAAFVFDMMEPERPKVDRAVLSRRYRCGWPYDCR
jgi:CRISPR/Cas system-associated endonuclease Cas1